MAPHGSKEYIEIDLHFSAPVYVTACGSPLSAVHVSEALRCASCPPGCVLSAAFSRFPCRGKLAVWATMGYQGAGDGLRVVQMISGETKSGFIKCYPLIIGNRWVSWGYFWG